MNATNEELATLLELQHVDMELVRINKQIDALPQRKVIVAARRKIAAIKEKQGKVAALRAEAERKLSLVSDEDERLAEKQRAAQEAVDAAGGYRDVEHHAKEMGGIAKRRATLEEDLDKLGAELAKISELEAQVASALSRVEEQEQQAVASFQAEGGKLRNDEARVLAVHNGLAAKLPPELKERYEKTAERLGGVAVARLVDNRCGACRATIDGGRLIDLKSHGPLGECPNCKRILVIE